MTDEEANYLLRHLQTHFHEPVMPLSYFCKTMQKWIECIEQGVAEKTSDYQHGVAYENHLRHILTDIHKSNLLARLFNAEEPRTKKCPEHKGHWSGLETLDGVCPHGCGLTGWLPEVENAR